MPLSFQELPKFNLDFSKLKALKNRTAWGIILIIFVSAAFGFAGGIIGNKFYLQTRDYLEKLNLPSPAKEYLPQTTQEEAIIKAVKDTSPAVVSIIISKDVPVFEQYYYNPFEGFEQFFGPSTDFLVPQYRQKGT